VQYWALIIAKVVQPEFQIASCQERVTFCHNSYFRHELQQHTLHRCDFPYCTVIRQSDWPFRTQVLLWGFCRLAPLCRLLSCRSTSRLGLATRTLSNFTGILVGFVIVLPPGSDFQNSTSTGFWLACRLFYSNSPSAFRVSSCQFFIPLFPVRRFFCRLSFCWSSSSLDRLYSCSM